MAGRKTKTAVLGGAFDPPTANHMLVAAEVIHSGMVDEVWLIPCGHRPDKPKLSKVLHRYVMTQICVTTGFSPDMPISVSDEELHEPEMLPTYDLLRKLRGKHPNREFSFVVGTDWLQPGTDIRQWVSKDDATGEDIVTGDKLLEEFDFLVVQRPGYGVSNLSEFGARMKWLQMDDGFKLMGGNVSSTEVRARRQLSTKPSGIVPHMLSVPHTLIEGLVAPAVQGFMCRAGLDYSDAVGPPAAKAGALPGRLWHSLSMAALSLCCAGPDAGLPPRRRNIAVFGGAFDPPTNSHIIGLAEILHSHLADEVLMVPCGKRPDKPQLRPPLQRYLMCEMAVNSSFSETVPIKVSDLEIFEPEALATYDSLTKLQKVYPDANLMFVIGTDWLQPGTNIREWTSKCPETGKEIVTGHKLVEEFDFLVIHRPGYEVSNLKAFGSRMRSMKMPQGMKSIETNISSTEVRKRVQACAQNGARAVLPIDGIVPPAVFSYIKREGMYR